MRLEELDFDFPRELIAQRPAEPRDTCRLMVVDPADSIEHRVFSDLPELLTPGDVLVLNDSRVLKARLFAHREGRGLVELLFLHPLADGQSWEALAKPSRRLRAGSSLVTAGGARLELGERLGDGRWRVRAAAGGSILALLDEQGVMPFPPYISGDGVDPGTYQTIYAAEPGSAAAPTAGLHFTPQLLDRLRSRGMEIRFVTLHIGLDTFRPISARTVEEHEIHSEVYSLASATREALNTARREGRRLVAVGTTSVRVLETLFRDAGPGQPAPETRTAGATSLFITPGYRFRAVDAMITNFHLPRTSLLALVMAFAGVEVMRKAYADAIASRYRFFSFGDAMLLTRPAGISKPAERAAGGPQPAGGPP